MEATAIIPRSALEQRYDRARDEFNTEYERSKYKLKDKAYYLGGGGNNWRTQCEILALIESEIKKSYLEDTAPEDWEEMREYRNDLLESAIGIYQNATTLVLNANARYAAIQAEVESRLQDDLDTLHHHDVVDMELDIISELVDTRVEYYIDDHTEHCRGSYDTPAYVHGKIEIDYTVTVYDKEGDEEQEITDSFKF